jgi:hypothetical protein
MAMFERVETIATSVRAAEDIMNGEDERARSYCKLKEDIGACLTISARYTTSLPIVLIHGGSTQAKSGPSHELWDSERGRCGTGRV